jgi:antitoxin CptB
MAANSRVLWRCRRGIREMDLVFSRFLETHYDQLTAEDSALFDGFLLENDLDIYDWILGRREPPAEYLGLLRLMQPPGPA